MKIPALFLALALPAAATNVVFMMADDLGYMDTGFNNPRTFYEPPNLNGLAKSAILALSALGKPRRHPVLRH